MLQLVHVVYQRRGVCGLVGGNGCFPGVKPITVAITAGIVFGQRVRLTLPIPEIVKSAKYPDSLGLRCRLFKFTRFTDLYLVNRLIVTFS